VETVTKNMPSPALCTNFETPSSKPRAFQPHPVLPTNKQKNGHKWAYEVKRAKSARKFVTLTLFQKLQEVIFFVIKVETLKKVFFCESLVPHEWQG